MNEAALISPDFVTPADLTGLSASSGWAGASTLPIVESGAYRKITLTELFTGPTFAGVSKYPDGSASAPSLSGANYTTTGLYWASGLFGVAVGGVRIAAWIGYGLLIGADAVGASNRHLTVSAATAPAMEYQVAGVPKYVTIASASQWSVQQSGIGDLLAVVGGRGALFPKSAGFTPLTYVGRPSAPAEGDFFVCSDATTSTLGATISAGGGANKVLAYRTASAWIVAVVLG